MASRLRIGRLLETANTIDMLLYVRDHPGCRRSDIYREVTRNAHTTERMALLADEGLLEMVQASRGAVLLRLTPTGEEVVALIERADRLLPSNRL